MRTVFQSFLMALAIAGCSRTVASPTPRQTGSRPTAAARTPPTVTTSTAAALADDLLARTNAERRNAGLPALARSLNLMRAAQLQADQMARLHRLDHELPGAPYPTLASRLDQVAYAMRAAGENIGEGYRSTADALSGWMKSSGHRANIVSPKYTEIGTAIAAADDGTRYWVQVFGRPR